jgi:hypothetical protein
MVSHRVNYLIPTNTSQCRHSVADNDGFYNASNHPNYNAFATLQTNGSIMAWGNSNSGGSGAPADNGYTKIYSTAYAFAALRADGSIEAWGDSGSGGTHRL